MRKPSTLIGLKVSPELKKLYDATEDEERKEILEDLRMTATIVLTEFSSGVSSDLKPLLVERATQVTQAFLNHKPLEPIMSIFNSNMLNKQTPSNAVVKETIPEPIQTPAPQPSAQPLEDEWFDSGKHQKKVDKDE